jgi:hypothetical protein
MRDPAGTGRLRLRHRRPARGLFVRPSTRKALGRSELLFPPQREAPGGAVEPEQILLGHSGAGQPHELSHRRWASAGPPDSSS